MCTNPKYGIFQENSLFLHCLTRHIRRGDLHNELFMGHLPTLINDLALILITAGVVTILFKWLRQPVVLGYIVAGILISPHFYILPSVADSANISSWAQIGVIILLFGLGLEFSFRRLIHVGGTAAVATVINIGAMIALGYSIGQFLNWSGMESLFLGGMLSMSSTIIIIKAFDDMGLKKHKFANVVFGMLIVEDLAAILMMVLFSTIAVSKQFHGMELVNSGLKLIFFILIWFVAGILLIPSILRRLSRFLNDETLLILSFGLCLGMVFFADAIGFSAALGAFIMGSILAETVESKRIEHLVEPLKNLFGAIFFVSVGMMITPGIIIEYAVPILIITAAVLIGRILFATLGVMAAGQGLKVGIQSGFSLAQIGEFSFIIAALGLQLGVIGEFLYPIIVIVSLITTFTTPYFIRASEPVYRFIERKLPRKLDMLITGYATSGSRNLNRENDWRKHLKSVLTTVTLYFVLSLALALLAKNYLDPFIRERIPGTWGSVLSAVIALGFMAPLMSVIMARGTSSEEATNLRTDSHFNKAGLILLDFLRLGVCVVLTAVVLIPLFPRTTGFIMTLSIIIAIGLAFWQGFRDPSRKIEKRFLDNLKNKERIEAKRKPVAKTVRDELLHKNIHIEEIEVPQYSPIVGRSISELDLRKKIGVNIACIIRGQRKINIPDKHVRIYPFDTIVVVGSDSQLQDLLAIINESTTEAKTLLATPQYQINLSKYEITEGSPLSGKTIKEMRVQDRTECIITGIERDGNVITNFTADIALQKGDILWLAGGRKSLPNFEMNLNEVPEPAAMNGGKIRP